MTWYLTSKERPPKNSMVLGAFGPGDIPDVFYFNGVSFQHFTGTKSPAPHIWCNIDTIQIKEEEIKNQ